VKVHDLRSGDVIQSFSSGQPIFSIRFSIDGATLMYASNSLGNVWDLARKTPVSTIYYDGCHPAFSLDRTCIASTLNLKDNHLVRIWKRSEKGHEPGGAYIHHRTDNPIVAIAFSLDRHLVATTTNRMLVKVWDAAMGTCLSVFKGVVRNHLICTNFSVVFSANSMFIACYCMA
jgi:WD40 repeat protein